MATTERVQAEETVTKRRAVLCERANAENLTLTAAILAGVFGGLAIMALLVHPRGTQITDILWAVAFGAVAVFCAALFLARRSPAVSLTRRDAGLSANAMRRPGSRLHSPAATAKVHHSQSRLAARGSESRRTGFWFVPGSGFMRALYRPPDPNSRQPQAGVPGSTLVRERVPYEPAGPCAIVNSGTGYWRQRLPGGRGSRRG